MTKKAMILYYLIIPGFIAALIFFLVLVYSSQQGQSSSFTGEPALALVSAAQDADRMLLYVDKAAPIAAYGAVSQVAANGGFDAESACGRYFGYNTWGKKCTPNMYDTLELAFNKKMRSLLASYPVQKEQHLLSTESKFYLSSDMDAEESDMGYYKLFARDTILVGSRSQPVRVNILFQNATHRFQIGEYLVLPNFNVKTSYNFNHIAATKDRMHDLLDNREKDTRDYLYAVFAKWSADSLVQWTLQACAPGSPEEVFWDVAEHIQLCMQSKEQDQTAACTCDLSQTDLHLLGSEYSIVFDGQTAGLIDKESKEVARYSFEPFISLGYHKPVGGFNVATLAAASKFTLRWNGGNRLTVLDVGVDGKLSASKGLFRYKTTGTDIVALVDDAQRTGLYKDFSECPKPEVQRYRMCIQAGSVPLYDSSQGKAVEKTVNFKIAVDLS